ncbi:MAG: hypothetical protein R3339_07885 [Thermodesulfobacteriota bacterium]|nr:hypothetical protein [Thermodesulfobacteriota bacterium]
MCKINFPKMKVCRGIPWREKERIFSIFYCFPYLPFIKQPITSPQKEIGSKGKIANAPVKLIFVKGLKICGGKRVFFGENIIQLCR